jgi:6-phosphofructo-2-kinase/fructose-2,6-biphosphatase
VLQAQPQADIPSISIPLHTVIELTPLPDGTMGVEFIPAPIHLNGDGLHSPLAEARAAACPFRQQQHNQHGQPAAVDAAMLIAEGGLECGYCLSDHASGGMGMSIADMRRMSSCSTGSTVMARAAMAAIGGTS